uniref:Uncharacterized protein n=1 Tax=Medicago truncatula TaxID=3880 RepID=A2Q4I0_MEDTR|nr:hypothetical protein MtrDRAFT_AC157488g12v2 [Medicago truncatula]
MMSGLTISTFLSVELGLMVRRGRENRGKEIPMGQVATALFLHS